jgi:hypothetical protein
MLSVRWLVVFVFVQCVYLVLLRKYKQDIFIYIKYLVLNLNCCALFSVGRCKPFE